MDNKFKVNEVYHGFKLVRQEKINEIQSIARVFEHEKSGARLIHLENDDDNKVFCITFRTTPTNDTGVAHILEHSVLCGSKNFKSKDPFGDIAKSSLNTFLNAMTYNDRTAYPVSSRNEKDFMNLMHVYLDAVLYPNIYKNHQILRQEGWRYEIDPRTDNLIYKGVVYSEMQGALSSPQEVLAGEIYKSVFPNTTYSYISGGSPDAIPCLNQKDFEDFHRRFYHPSNSYIYLYGNQNLNECLKFINENYLVNFDKIEIPSHIGYTNSFDKMSEIISKYSINKEENTENKSFLSLNFVCGENSNPEEYLASKILYNILIESGASPIKQALFKEEIGESMLNFNDMNMDPTKQIIFPIAVKNVDMKKTERFKEIIFETLKSLVENGIDKELLKASINSIEFELREADPFKIANKGLYYNDKVLESWLYDGDPLAHLKYEDNLNKIKNSINNGYFEDFIEKYMLKNNHCSLVILNPERGLQEEKVKILNQKLQNYKKSLSSKELENLKHLNEELSKIQIAEDTEEAKKTIPRLSINEVSNEVEKIPQIVEKQNGITMLSHNMNTNKILYLNLLFDARVIPQKYINYMGLLRDVLGKLNTKNTSYSDLVTKIYKNTGGINFDIEVYNEKNNTEKCYPKFIVKSKVLSENIQNLFDIINEIINLTDFNDIKRIKEIIKETKSRLQMKVIGSGNVLSISRATSCFSKADKYYDMVNGSLYYEFLCSLEEKLKTNPDEIISNLKQVYSIIFNKNNLIISFVGEKGEEDKLKSNINIVLDNLKDTKLDVQEINFNLSNKVQALVTASNVYYVAKAFNLEKLNFKYSGTMNVLQIILNNEYLYKKVRLQGGAYGCYMNIGRRNNIAFASYRDPNLIRTIDVYDEAFKFLQDINYTKDDMEKFIIGSIGRTYKPLTPERKGEFATRNYISNINYEDLQKEKDELLNTKLEDIKNYSEMIEKGMKENYCCVAGNETEIRKNKEIFDEINILL